MTEPAENKHVVLLEALEDRIAPASFTLSQGGNLLSAGDEGTLSNGDSPAVLVKVLAGKAQVFWDAQAKSIKGISLTNGANLEIHGDVSGDIVTNLLPSGLLTDTDNNPTNGQDGGKLLPSSIAGIKVTSFIDQFGNIQSGSLGRIVAGGAISNVNVSGALGGVYSGDGIFDAIATAASPNLTNSTPGTTYSFQIGFDFDSSGELNATAMTLTKANAKFATNAPISNVSFTSGKDVQIFAGDGADGVAGAAAAGSSISKVRFVATTVDGGVTSNFFQGKSLTISAGDGGSGTAYGGAGGAITDVAEGGSSGNVVIHSGQGGEGLTTGGAGGKISLLDLRGTPLNYLVQAGNGGGGGTTGGVGGSLINNNIAAVSSSQFITLAGDFHSDFSDGAKNDAERGFFVINRSSGEMVLIAGDTLNLVAPTIQPLAANPVDAITTDVNGDNFLDVVVAYNDGHFGVLLNNTTDGFTYSVGSLGGLIPAKVIAGDFLGTGGRPELAFVANTGPSTTIKMFEATNPNAFATPNPAAAFTSDPLLIKPFVYNKSGLVDAVGGGFPLGSVGALHLNSDSTDDLLLAFGDGRIQGVYATGAGTLADPFTFSLGSGPQAAPFVKLAGGVKDVDFNFAKKADQQRLAIVNAAGTNAYIATISEASLTKPAALDISKDPLPLPKAGGVGTIYVAQWTNSVLDTKDTSSTSLALLASGGSSSTILSYDTAFALKKVYSQDFQINGLTNNFLIASKSLTGEADSFILTTPSSVHALAFQHVLPASSPIGFADISLPYAAKSVNLIAGDGGTAGKGAGGWGGNISGLNLDSGATILQAGDGGLSILGGGGNGGSVDNTLSFRTASNVLITPGLSSSDDLTILAGNGASVTGAAAAATGGTGGNVKSLLILDAALLSISAGDGGDSKGALAGGGGFLTSITIYNAGDATLNGGDGGAGASSVKAAGGNGGGIFKITVGNKTVTDGNAVSGDFDLTAGDGGTSSLAKGGNGGSVSGIAAGNFLDSLGAFLVTAGNGGTSSGLVTAAGGGSGGFITGLTLNQVKGTIELTAGSGGSAVVGTAGNGGYVSTVLSTKGGVLSAVAGDGGQATGAGSKGRGGNGGTVSGLNAEMVSSGYSNINGGSGGNSVGAAGGTGGAIYSVALKLNPSDSGAGDETLGVSVRTGSGGNGTSGGSGGLLSLFQATGVYDELNGVQTAINSIALRLAAGNGGSGSITTGGAGGAIQLGSSLIGISHVDGNAANVNFQPGDEGLRVFAGNGGNGITLGGAGGAISGIKVSNALNSAGNVIPVNLLGGASVIAGDGGNAVKGTAGAGGAVSGLSLGVEGPSGAPTGNLRVQAGDGGTATLGTGAQGGSVSGSKLVVIKGNDAAGYGLLVTGGDGGNGSVRGGAGGNLTNLVTTLPQLGVANTAPNIYSGVFLAGAGGSGTGALKSTGGAGGNISGITQTQNVYSVMNLVQAGNGGNSSADVVGGKGGYVYSLSTVGSIGAQTARVTNVSPPVKQGIVNTIATSTLIDSLVTTPNVQQGVFAGLGGSGLKEGANGSVSGVKARYISAIAAADLDGHFEKAVTVSSITTLVLGYDVNGSGDYQAGDGFVMAGNNKITGLYTFDKDTITAAALQAATTPFIIP